MIIKLNMDTSSSPCPTRKLLALSTSLRDKTHDEIIEICLKSGFSGIEVHTFMTENMDESSLVKIREKYQESGLKLASFHLPYMDLAALDESERIHALERFKITLRQAAALGARVGIAHPTKSGDVTASGLDPLLDALERSLSELIPLADSLGIIIAIENLGPSGINRLGSAPEHFVAFKRRFQHESLGFCLDTGHALLSLHERAIELAQTMKDHLKHFHLNDNAGDRDSHLAPGRGLVDWTSIARLLQELNFTHAACVETPPFAFGPNYSLEAWRELYLTTAKLLPI